MKRTALMLIAGSCWLVCAQTTRDPDDVLRQVRAKLKAMTERLPRYTCVQTVERRYFLRPERKNEPSCDQVMGDRKAGRYKTRLYATDRLRLDVAVSQGREIVSWAGAGKFDSRSVDDVVGEGPTGTGAFGLHLVDVFSNSGVRFQYQGEKTVEGNGILEYRFTVPQKASNYRIRGNGDWHFTAYDGTFQIDAKTLELERLDLRTDELPEDTGMCESGTSLAYQKLHVGDSDFLLPRKSELRIIQTNAHETLNVTTFSGCRQYHTESTIRFEEAPEAGVTEAKAAGEQAKTLPVGLALSLALTARIDTSSAAAGDLVSAKVMHAVKDPKSKAILIPAGAIARGRITRMRHRIGGPDDFIVLISFDALEVNGRVSPLFLQLDAIDQLERVRVLNGNRRASRMMAVQGPETWGAMIFPSAASQYVVPAGYETVWKTVEAPEKKPENLPQRPGKHGDQR